jgi:hypothetical protein
LKVRVRVLSSEIEEFNKEVQKTKLTLGGLKG